MVLATPDGLPSGLLQGRPAAWNPGGITVTVLMQTLCTSCPGWPHCSAGTHRSPALHPLPSLTTPQLHTCSRIPSDLSRGGFPGSPSVVATAAAIVPSSCLESCTAPITLEHSTSCPAAPSLCSVLPTKKQLQMDTNYLVY